METQQPEAVPGRWHTELGGWVRQFQLELPEFWQRLPNKGLFFVLLLAWFALFHFLGNSTFGYVDTSSLLGWMNNSYGPGSDDAHGKLVPFVVVPLFWWKRRLLLATSPTTWWPGLFLVAGALLLHVLGYTVQQPRVSIVAFFFGLYGLMGLVWGPGWLRASFFPFFLFAFCIPVSSITEGITFRLRLLVCRLVEWISPLLLATDVRREGTMLLDPSGHYQYEVAAACSGIRSLTAIFALAVIYGFVFFPATWKRLVLLASALPLAVLGNLLRMLVIVAAAEFGGQAAGNYIHESSLFSLLPYIPAFVGLLLLGSWLERPRKSPDRSKT